MHNDALADRLAVPGVVQEQIVVERPDLLGTEGRACHFRQGILQGPERDAGGARHAGLVSWRQCRRVLASIALEELAIRVHVPLLDLWCSEPRPRSLRPVVAF